jgi:hypothetical protein
VIFYMSKDGRNLYALLSPQTSSIESRMFADQCALMFPAPSFQALIENYERTEITKRKATMKDFPGIFLHRHAEGYRYITEQYITRDLSRSDLILLAILVAQYDERIIMRIGNRCKANGVFSIPYLSSSLDQEGSQVIEEVRREERLDKAVLETTRLDLPSYRPTNIIERAKEIALDQHIDDFLEGR